MFKKCLFILGCSSFLFAFGACGEQTEEEAINSEEMNEKGDSLTSEYAGEDVALIQWCMKFRWQDTCHQVKFCEWKSSKISWSTLKKKRGYCTAKLNRACGIASNAECNLRTDTCQWTPDPLDSTKSICTEKREAAAQPSETELENQEQATYVAKDCDYCMSIPTSTRMDEFCGRFNRGNCPSKYCETNSRPWKLWNMTEASWFPQPHRHSYCVAKRTNNVSCYQLDNIECSFRDDICKFEWSEIDKEIKCIPL